MKWTTLLVIAAIVVVFLLLKRSRQVSAHEAEEYLKNGALVIDVRSPGEFQAGHLPKAINIPLDEIETAMPRRGIATRQVLLLHCQSGIRSELARKRLRSIGYEKVFNLGSFERAKAIVGNAADK